ncbi:hypothetical protein PR048_026018 [Dryococelus australis]|uniref:Uncharacterized protein n=1 Tax=Dryococelus australis TaxID=614101 RepID=A0ABQ9GK83_9NEOP|nr:hypothetical protein PR048_026018 [Dryococelus australis]
MLPARRPKGEAFSCGVSSRRTNERAATRCRGARPNGVCDVGPATDSNHSPLTWANRFRFPTGSHPDFRMWDSCRTMPLVGGFSRGFPVLPPFHSGTVPYSPHFILVGSQDLDVKSRPNLFTHSRLFKVDEVEAIGRRDSGGKGRTPWKLTVRHVSYTRYSGREASSSGRTGLKWMLNGAAANGHKNDAGATVERCNLTYKSLKSCYLIEISNRQFRRFGMNVISISSPALNSNGATVFSVCLRYDLRSSFELRWCNRPLVERRYLRTSSPGHSPWTMADIRAAAPGVRSLRQVPRDPHLPIIARRRSFSFVADSRYSAPGSGCVCVVAQRGTSVARCSHKILFIPAKHIWMALDMYVLRADAGDRWVWSSAEIEGRGKREISEKTHRPTASSGTIPTCENPETDEDEARRVWSSSGIARSSLERGKSMCRRCAWSHFNVNIALVTKIE